MQKFDVVSPQYRPNMMSFILDVGGGVSEVSQVVCVADSGGSLNSTYFLLNTPDTNYYVWMNVNAAGVDPAVASRTGVEIALATNASNTTVATAVQTALDALATVKATVSSATVTVTNNEHGSVTNAADGAAATGFTITTPTQGVNGSFSFTFGQFDATVAETSTTPGDYTITFNEPFVRAPQVAVLPTTSVVPRIVSVSTTTLRIECNGLDGDPKDSGLHILVVGSQASDAI